MEFGGAFVSFYYMYEANLYRNAMEGGPENVCMVIILALQKSVRTSRDSEYFTLILIRLASRASTPTERPSKKSGRIEFSSPVSGIKRHPTPSWSTGDGVDPSRSAPGSSASAGKKALFGGRHGEGLASRLPQDGGNRFHAFSCFCHRDWCQWG